MSDSRAVRDNSVQSVDRAVSILQVLARYGEVGVTEIANELSVHKSTVSRLLGTLEARGLVEQSVSRGRYRLGYGVVQLADGVSRKHDLTLIDRTVCTALAEDVGETVNVCVHEADTTVTIDQVAGSSSVMSTNWVGRRDPLYATSAGKIFLANLPVAELQPYLDAEMTPFTEYTIVDPVRLEAELVAVRERGFSWTYDEQEIGLAAIAAPIRTLNGQVIGALTVSGPTFRIGRDRIDPIAKRLLQSAAEISERNGYPKAG